jgi:TP901 family phage tail tape measure protein
MASSDIIKIGFDYRSSLAQFEKDTNGVFDGISSKAGKQKITIQLDAKDDKVIDKIKELQKLKLDKFTFEFGNSGLKEQLQTFDKLENKINEIINLGKGKSIIDSSSTIKEIDKINKSLNKTSEILNKSFSTKNKTEAFNQLKEASVAYEKFYGNEKAMATQEGTQAAYNYYKAYEEALKKGVAQTRLEKVTIDVEKGYNFNSSDLSSRRIKEFENYQKYGGDLSDLSLEIASLDGKLKDFSSAYAEVKKNLGEAPITPEIISNIEHYVELLDKVRYLKSWHKSDDKDIIAQDESSAKYFLDSAIYKAQEQNYNYTDSLKTQEIQAIATAEAEKKLAETQKEVSFTSSETNISLGNVDSIVEENTALQKQEGQIAEINNGLGQEKTLLDQMIERIEKIRMLGVVGGGRTEEDILNNFGVESKNAQAYQMQIDALKTLTPSGKNNPEIRDMVLNPDISVQEVAEKLIEAAKDYESCKNALDKLFFENNIVGGKVFDDAYRDLNAFADDSMKMVDIVAEARKKVATINKETQSNESNTSDSNSAVEQKKKDISDIIKLTDNYGRELDEANSKLLKGTTLLDEQGKIIRLYHGSDTEFDKFDLSRSNNQNNQIYGKGAYLIESQKGAEGYGSVVTQWYANVRKVMNEEGRLTLKEAQKLYNEFGSQLLNIFGKRMDFDEFFDSYIKFDPEETTVVEKMKSLASYLGKDIGDLFQAIGYDAIKMDRSNGSFYTIFDPDRLVRFKEAAVETTSAVKKLGASASQNPKKDAFQVDNSSTTNASTSAIKEENNALEQTAQSAEKAANSKKKFAKANQEVKDSANASVGAIKDENNAFDKNKWDKNVKAIQKYMDAVTELNHLKAKDKGTGKNASVIADPEQEVERLKNIAYEAKKTLSSIANSNKADVNTWEKWVNVMKQFDQASQGSTRSIARLEDAMRNANNFQIEYMNSVIKRFQNSYDKYSTDASRNGYNPSVEFSDKLSSFNSSLNDLKNLSSSISNGEFVKQEQIDSFKRLTQNAEEAQKALKNMSASEKGMKSVSVQKEIDKINQLLRENTRYSKEAKIELRSLITQLMSGDPTVNLEAIHTKVMEIKNAEELAGRAGKNFFDILASKSYYGFIGQMQSYLSMYVGFYGMMNSFRNGLSTVRELNTALTEMRKVSEETTQSLKNYQNTTFDVANVVGTTAKQIQNSTADWMRLGESMSEAAESAKDANILFNVSEFEGIDEATESLVSMSQAYKDLDKMDIIDVLNNIGNNYSISTDGLATALKDSASALVTANNDLNEAVSLTTAGNAITQDPSKVGAGLRTISLRLVGTEAAKQELSDLGEETDGMITTVSKLRDTIMDATKAASADGKGFDILDSNGNYKSTYEIMQGLADLYDDIVTKDKELGTNNLNLLLETIAGKNRSNIAASILQNGEMLKSVYEDAQNSEGSAENELNSYLDSVDAKLQQLSNRAQEFWFRVIDSETIKKGIDLLTTLTKGATDFVDTIGILPTLLTGIGAGIAFKNVGEHYIVPVSI